MNEISIGYGRQPKDVKITFPGGIVDVRTGFQTADGQPVVYVRVSADGDRYSGEPKWWARWGKVDKTGGLCRIVQEVKEP